MPRTIEELKGLLEKATPSPWRAGHYSSIVGLPITAQPDKTKNTFNLANAHGPMSREECEANAALIVAAVNSLPALIACVAALKKLSFQAQTSGGVAGRDDALFEAIGVAEKALSALDLSSSKEDR